jgi:putative intracellular protease/amidase
MSAPLSGRTVAFLMSNSGVEQAELTEPRSAVADAGGDWRDEEVFVCPRNDWTLITSRKPDDLAAFSKKIVETLSS